MNPMIGIIMLGILCLFVLIVNIAIIVYGKRKQRWERITSYYKEK